LRPGYKGGVPARDRLVRCLDPVLLLLSGLAPLLLYRGALGAFFVADDFAWLECASDSLRHPAHLFTLHISGFLRPLAHLTFAELYRLAGTGAVAYHGAAIALHLGCVLLLGRLALALTRDRLTAALAALCFALIPAYAEVGVWISALGEPLAACLMLCSLISWCTWLGEGRRRAYLLTLFGFVLALAAKESAAVLPGWMLLLHAGLARKGRAARPSWRPYLPFAALLAGFLALQLLLHRRGYLVSEGQYALGWQMLPQIARSLGRILDLAWAPFLAAAAAALLRREPWPARRLPALLCWAAAAALALAPYAGFRWPSLAGRYLYLASMPVAGLAALGLGWLLRSGRLADRLLAGAALLLLGVQAVHVTGAAVRRMQARALESERFVQALRELPGAGPELLIANSPLPTQQLRGALRLFAPRLVARARALEPGELERGEHGRWVYRWLPGSGRLIRSGSSPPRP